jgi:hypothetical protein
VEDSLKRLAELEADKAESSSVGMIGFRKLKGDGEQRRVAIRVGKFVRQFFGALPSTETSGEVVLNDQTIQVIGADITALLWSNGDGNEEDDVNGVKELEGGALRNFYLESVSGIRSCMAYKEAQEYLDIYVDNPDRVKLAAVRMNGGAGRALVWTLPNGKRYMDRIYTTGDESCRAALKNYAERKGMGRGEKIPPGKMPMKIRDGEDSYWPYMDTFRYLSIVGRHQCELFTDDGDYCLQTTDGRLEDHEEHCHFCGTHVDDERYSGPDGETYCRSCYDEQFFYCEACGNDRCAEDSVEIADGTHICQQCYEQNYFTCEDCDRIFNTDEAVTIDGGDRAVCNSCYEDNYFVCDDCDEVFHVDDQHDGPDNTHVCEECAGQYDECSECGEVFEKDTLVDGFCPDCATDKLVATAKEVETHA